MLSRSYEYLQVYNNYYNNVSLMYVYMCSLLGLGGGNRRTVHIRSKGFSKLFSLSRADLQRSLVDYPEAQEILSRRSHTDDNVQTEEVR